VLGGGVVVLIARGDVGQDATENVTPREAESIVCLAAGLARASGRHCIVAADRHIDLVRDRVSRHRMRAGAGCSGPVRARRRSGVYNAKLDRAGIGKEVMIVAGIEPDFVGPTLARKVSDGAPGLIVDDQSAREGELVIWPERDARSSGAAGCIKRRLREVEYQPMGSLR
jgi:hypothetical protein